MTRFRGPLTRGAIGIAGSATDGEELADSLYSEMFGLTERYGQRQSPLASYSGRGSSRYRSRPGQRFEHIVPAGYAATALFGYQAPAPR